MSATLDRGTTTAGESVTLSLIFEGAAPKAAPVFPAMTNLTINYLGQSSQYTLANGRASSSLTFSYEVTPAKPGEYIIPAITMTLDRQTVTSQPLKLKVVKSGDASTQADEASGLAFLKLVLPRNQVYVGETFPAEIQLYAQGGQLRQLPQLHGDGFTMGKMIQEGGETRVQMNNTAYSRLIYKVPVVVVKTGELKLQAGNCLLDVQFRRRTQRNRDPFGFDPLGDLFGDRVETRHFNLSSDPLTLQAMPLPKLQMPGHFTGAVGKFSMAASASPTNVAVGDPITVKIQISGRGAFDSLTLPEPEGWKEFKVYPPTSKLETANELGLEGTKTFEQVVVPQNTEVTNLPDFAFSYFDPELKLYRTLNQPAIPLIVRPTASAQLPASNLNHAGQTQESPAVQELVHIKPSLGAVAAIGSPLFQRRWFLALQGAPLFAWLAALVWRKRSERLANNPRLRRQRQVAQMIQTGVAELNRMADENRCEAFFATVFRLLQEQLGERLALPATAITEAVIEERLRPSGVAEQTLADLEELFQICNQARYAPDHSGQELAALLPKVESTLRELRQIEVGI